MEKFIKNYDEYFKLNETGDWDDADEEMGTWKVALREAVMKVKKAFPTRIKLLSVKGFDKYRGPYAATKIDGKVYDIWTIGEDNELYIEDYPVSNIKEYPEYAEGSPGFIGRPIDIIAMLKHN